MKGATLMLGALALLLGCAGQARADFIVDQSFLWGPGESVGYDPYDRSPVGVIFVPTLSSVNHVQIVLYPFRGFAGQATMHVLIRQDTIQGPILGTSSETTIPAGRAYYITPPLPLTDFTFANAVSLTPGHPYVIQAVQDSGDTWWLLGQGSFTGPLGNAVIDGVHRVGFDFDFQEGISSPVAPVPESSSLTLLGIGAISLLGYGWRRRKRVTA